MKILMTIQSTLAVVILGLSCGCGANPGSSPSNAAAQGDWSGVLEVQGQSLPLVIHLGPETARLDSPSQGASELPLKRSLSGQDELVLENAALDLKLTLSLDQARTRLAGSFEQAGLKAPIVFKPGLAGAASAPKPQDPQAPYPYDTRELHFLSADGQTLLAGTLTLPNGTGPMPALVLVSGSGPQDRDENIAGHKPFWIIADSLARAGIAALRYDDRGVAGSKGDFATATTMDFVQDAQGAVAALRQALGQRAGKIGMAGHSEGGLVAPMVQASYRSLEFLVLLAAPGVDIVELMLRQNADIGRLSGMAESQIAMAADLNQAIYQLAASDQDNASARGRIHELLARTGMDETAISRAIEPVLTPWFRQFIALKPSDALSKVTVPVLALGGDKDCQVWATGNLAAIKQALGTSGNSALTSKRYPGLNHLFQHATTGLPAEYAGIQETIAPKVLDDMKAWILGLR